MTSTQLPALQGVEITTLIAQEKEWFTTTDASSVGSFTKRLRADGLFHEVEQWKSGKRPQSCIADPRSGEVRSLIALPGGQLMEIRRMVSRTRMEMVSFSGWRDQPRSSSRLEGFLFPHDLSGAQSLLVRGGPEVLHD